MTSETHLYWFSRCPVYLTNISGIVDCDVILKDQSTIVRVPRYHREYRSGNIDVIFCFLSFHTRWWETVEGNAA